MTKLAFVDLETTGLDPQRHEIWDVGIIIEEDEAPAPVEYQWFLPVTLKTADSMALTVGKFYERHPHFTEDMHALSYASASSPRVAYTALSYGQEGQPNQAQVQESRWVAHKIARLTAGAHLVGNVVSFDAAFLEVFLRANGAAPNWHYHLVDCEALVAGRLGQAPPWKSKELSAAVGVTPPGDDEAHSALVDARWARDLYYAALQERD